MLYKILIKNSNGTCNYAQMKVFDTETVTDINGVEVTVAKETSHLEDFSSTDITKVKAKYVELMDQYKPSQIDVVADMKEIVSISVEIEDMDTTSNGDDDSTGDVSDNTSGGDEPSDPVAGEGSDTNPAE